ncbi:hypothetical protein Tco_0719135 [Tanacetum coccineum]
MVSLLKPPYFKYWRMLFSSNFSGRYSWASSDFVPNFMGNTYSSFQRLIWLRFHCFTKKLLSLFHDDPYMKVMQAYYAKESPIPPSTIMPPSPMLSPMFNPHEFFQPEELLPPKKRGYDRSSSSTSALPQEFEMGESSHFDNLETELQEARTQIVKLQRKQMGNNNKIALARFRIANLDIQVRHQADKENLLDAIYEHKNSQEGPSDY